jgi:hypothetical protein
VSRLEAAPRGARQFANAFLKCAASDRLQELANSLMRSSRSRPPNDFLPCLAMALSRHAVTVVAFQGLRCYAPRFVAVTRAVTRRLPKALFLHSMRR